MRDGTLAAVERISTAEAAHRLNISATQVRRLVRSGKLPAEAEQRPQGTRLVILWDAPTTQQDAPEVATSDATHATNTTRLENEVRWLRERLERAEEERSELRRMLNLEQQTVAALRSMPLLAPANDAPEDATYDATRTHQHAPAASTMPATPLDGAEQPDTSSVKQVLKDAGVGKRKRRKLLERLAGLLGR